MASSEILTAYIKKLGHPLREIRERALTLLVAKLRLGWELEDELDCTRQLLESLLAWFQVQKPSLQEEALSLFLTVIKTKAGTYIAKEFGIKDILKKLHAAQSKINPDAVEIYDDVMETLKFLNTVQSADNVSVPHLRLPSVASSETEESSAGGSRHGDLGTNFLSSQASSESNGELDTSKSKTSEGIKVLLFPWCDLCASDSKTILLIEDALKLLKSTRRCCRFIRDVFLRDFPAEIFLNRPAIIKNLSNIVDSNNGRLSESLQVLLCITQALCNRLGQLYSPELMHQMKYDPTTVPESEDRINIEMAEIVSGTELAADARAQDDGLLALRQLPAPVFALDLLHTVLAAMARSVVLADPKEKTELLDMTELNLCLSLCEHLIRLLLSCVGAGFWRLDHVTRTHRDVAHKACMAMRLLGDILTKYRASFAEDTVRAHHRAAWLRLLPCGQSMLQWAGHAALPPVALVAALQMALLDPALDMTYPELAASILQTVQCAKSSTNAEYKSKYRELTKLFEAMEDAAKFMKNKQNLSASKAVLSHIKNSLPVLELHCNETFLKDVSEVLLRKIKDWDLNEEDWTEARVVALNLMAHNSEWVRGKFYRAMADMVKKVFLDDSSDQTENEKCLALLCDVGLLTEICCHGLHSTLKDVEENASEIMLYLLRGRLILSESCWWRLLACLLPTLPLLHAYAAHDTQLGQAICKSLEPEIAKCMGVPETEVIGGLVRLLFVRCPLVQMDAAHTLCHILDDPKFLPPKESLRADVLIGALTRVQPHGLNVDLSKSTIKSPQTSSLVQILDVLKQDLAPEARGDGLFAAGDDLCAAGHGLSAAGHGLSAAGHALSAASHGLRAAGPHASPGLEPSLRRAALQQLSVLMLQQNLHDAFVKYDGIGTAVAILRMSLLVDDYLAFPECAISCVSILNSVCYGSRHSLAKITDLQSLLLRVILIFPANDNAVLMSAQILALLAWAGFALQELDAERARVLALPASVVRRTNTPFTVHPYWTTSANTVHSSIEWLQSEEEWRAAIRVRWSSIWNGPSRLLHDNSPPPGPLAMRVTQQDLMALQAACPLYSSAQALLTLQNATSHRQVNETLSLLECYTHLVRHSSVKGSDLAALPWRGTLSRFLTAPPASPRDIVLLTSLTKFVIAYMDNVSSEGGTMSWVKDAFVDGGSSMLALLSREDLYPQQSQHDGIEVTQLHTHIVRVLLRCAVKADSERDYDTAEAESLLKILLACLESIDLDNFHKLGYLNEVMRCIRYSVNSRYCRPSEDTLVRCLRLMTRTLTGCAAGGGRKGQGCRLDALLTLLALLRCLHEGQIPVQRWSEEWSGPAVRVLVASSDCARPELRAAALRVLAALALHAQLLPQLASAAPGGSPAQHAAAILARRGEAHAVRAAAAALLAALAARVSPHTDLHECEMLEQLREHSFIDNCLEILVEFCKNEIEPNNNLGKGIKEVYQISNSLQNVLVTKPNVPISLLERRAELEVRARKCAELVVVPTRTAPAARPPPTAGLLVELANVLYNLAGFAKAPLQSWNERGLFRLLFRCASWCRGGASERAAVRAATCRALARVCDAQRCARASLANTKDCLRNLLALLKPLYEDECNDANLDAHTQSLLLLAALLPESAASESVWEALKDNNAAAFFHLLLQSIEAIDSIELQKAGLHCLSQLTQSIRVRRQGGGVSDDSWAALLDGLPRAGGGGAVAGARGGGDCRPDFWCEELCRAVVSLCGQQGLEKNKYQSSPDLLWSLLASSLASLLAVSARARLYAVHCGLPARLLAMLQGVREQLTLHGKTAELIRNSNNNPVLHTLYWLLELMTCLMVECPSAKESLAADGVAVSLTRLWPWCMMADFLRPALVEFLLVFTNDCPSAWSSMCVCVGGRNLTTELCALASREAALASRAHCPRTLVAALRALRHCAKHHHCRALLLKSDVLASVQRLRVAERTRPARGALAAWARLAEALARHADGAGALLALRPALVAPAARDLLLPALAHAAHHHRAVFLQSQELLEFLSGTLLAGTTTEIVSAARAVWALAANNHRAKLALRSAGVSAATHTAAERLARARRDAAAERALQLLRYTDTVLHT